MHGDRRAEKDVHLRHTFGGIDNSDETPQQGKARRNLRDNGRLSLTLLLAGLFIVVIGAQAYLASKDDARDQKRVDAAITALKTTTECISTWGEDFANVTTTRVGSKRAAGTVDLEKAKERRDTALDRIILTVIAAREIPPTATTDDFDRVLEEYAAAIAAVKQVTREVDNTRALNPYPELHC